MCLGREVWQLVKEKPGVREGFAGTGTASSRDRYRGRAPASQTRALFSLLHPSQTGLKGD